MGRKTIRSVASLILLAGFTASAFSLSPITLRPELQVLIPVGNTSPATATGDAFALYSVGYGIDLDAGMDFFGFLSPFLQGGLGMLPINSVSGESLVYERGGAGLSVFGFPVPRLSAKAAVSGGMAYANYVGGSNSGPAAYWAAKGELGYRFSPTASLLAQAGFTQILGSEYSILKSVTAGLVFDISLDKLGGGGASGVQAEMTKQETLFPIVYYKSDKTPLGYVKLTNDESAEIRDVHVLFSAGDYTSRAAPCGDYPMILRGKTVDVPIYADFNDKVLGFSETSKIQGAVEVDYKILDAKRGASKAVAVVFNNRNSATWADDRVVGAFVSPQDPVMLELSKYIAGLVRVRSKPEIDKNLQYGMGLFEGLRVYGLVWAADPNMPYVEARKDPSKLAYIQYPYQTLSYKSGDSDSMAITLAEALESVAVPAAIAALSEDAIVAFPLDMGEAQARTTFSNLGNFIFEDGKAWVPLRASMMREGFLRAWQAGAELWASHAADEPKPELVKIDDAWKEYQPIALADVDYKPVKPSEEDVNLAFDSVLGRFVAIEVEPKAQRIISQIQGEGSGRQWNALGIVYAQYGLYDQARAQFEKAVAMNYLPALVNLANVAFLLKDFNAAADNFQKVLDIQPANKAALIGLARARYELDAYAEADELYAQVRTIDPALADHYAYLSSKVDVGVALRASAAAADRGGGMTWDEGD